MKSIMSLLSICVLTISCSQEITESSETKGITPDLLNPDYVAVIKSGKYKDQCVMSQWKPIEIDKETGEPIVYPNVGELKVFESALTCSRNSYWRSVKCVPKSSKNCPNSID